MYEHCCLFLPLASQGAFDRGRLQAACDRVVYTSVMIKVGLLCVGLLRFEHGHQFDRVLQRDVPAL